MSFNHLISAILRPVRFLVILFACTLILFSNAYPAVAAMGSARSNPSEGEAHLDEIQRKSEEVTKKDPLSLEETEKEANAGLNEIQGGADVKQMNRPSNSRQATTVEDQVKNALEKVTGRD
jgi:hypothetical protein